MNLDPQQRAAVESTDDVTLVLAGAGSGKTRVLTSRIAHLVSNGTPPSRILVATFTRRAANEIKVRLRKLGIEPTGMLCGTLHSVCRTLVGDDRTVLTQPAAERLLMRCARDLAYFNPTKRTWKHKLSMKKVRKALEHWYTTGEHASTDELLTLLNEYWTRLHATDTTDFGGILLECLTRLSQWGIQDRQIDHVLIDEYQDTDPLQQQIMKSLCPPAKLTMVGDPRQSIYRFRGAVPESTCGSHGLNPTYIPTSYRCPTRVIEVANAIAADDPYEPCREPMQSGTGMDGVVQFWQCDAEMLAYRIYKLTTDNAGISSGDVAVLARKRDSLRDLQLFLDVFLPTFLVGGELHELRGSRRAFHAMLQVIDRPDLWMGVEDLMEAIGCPDEERAAAWSAARDGNVSLLGGWAQTIANSKNIQQFTFMNVPGFIQTMDPDDSVKGVCEAFCDIVGGVAPFVIDWWLEKFGNRTVHQTVRWLSMADAQDFSDDAGDKVTLSTIHGAKGLEWPVVIVMDLNEGVIPRSDEDVDDDRRVLYVAATRAQSRLVLHSRPIGNKVGEYTTCGARSRLVPSEDILKGIDE